MLFASTTDYESFPTGSDGIELRLDHFPPLSFVSKFLSKTSLPVLLTVRRNVSRLESEREAYIRELFALKPAFIDLEWDMRPEFLEWAFTQQIPIVLSFHNEDETPEDLESIYASMQSYRAFTYKIATYAKTSSDALRLLLFAKTKSDVSAIAMGERGSFARVLGPVVGNQIDFAYVNVPTAPGQLSVQEMVDIYQYRNLSQSTALYGLIGNPVHASQGHLFHNRAFLENQIDAVYVKMAVDEKELPSFIPFAKQLGFQGLSVTMPLKEKVLPESGAINTLFFEEPLRGLSVDGMATLDLIGDVSNSTVVVIGAGGSAKAIAWEAKKRGAHVVIVNRTHKKAIALAAELHCSVTLPSHFDVLINCTPSSMPIDPEIMQSTMLVVDLVYSTKITPFLQAALTKGCRVIYGQEVFEKQARAQFEIWHAR